MVVTQKMIRSPEIPCFIVIYQIRTLVLTPTYPRWLRKILRRGNCSRKYGLSVHLPI